jgi:hypothetical protein
MRMIARHMTARADHPHPRGCTKLADFLADASSPDDTNRLIANCDRIVRFMIELPALLFYITQVESASEVKKTRQNILGYGTPVGEPA